MSKKDGRYGDFIEIADQDPKYLTELVPACIDELLTQLIAEARKDKNTPDMTTLNITVIDWYNMGKELDKCNEAEFKTILSQMKNMRDKRRRYTVGIRFESLNK